MHLPGGWGYKATAVLCKNQAHPGLGVRSGAACSSRMWCVGNGGIGRGKGARRMAGCSRKNQRLPVPPNLCEIYIRGIALLIGSVNLCVCVQAGVVVNFSSTEINTHRFFFKGVVQPPSSRESIGLLLLPRDDAFAALFRGGGLCHHCQERCKDMIP